jgi:hypothetical protein
VPGEPDCDCPCIVTATGPEFFPGLTRSFSIAAPIPKNRLSLMRCRATQDLISPAAKQSNYQRGKYLVTDSQC